jgi:hypothetical protein
MRVLLLDPSDTFSGNLSATKWDLIVDLARAPLSTHQRWAREAGCPAISLYQVAEEIGDLHALKRLLDLGLGVLVDRFGLDWWDITSLMVAPDVAEPMLVRRLAKQLHPGVQLFCSRPNRIARTLQNLLGCELVTFQASKLRYAGRRLKHYGQVISRFEGHELRQIAWDKFDSTHSIRRWLAPQPRGTGSPLVLLPSAYANVSQTAISYAAMLSDQQFLLVCARESGELRGLPPNVRSIPLASYYSPPNTEELGLLVEKWEGLRKTLIAAAVEFRLADAVGALNRVPALLRWGAAIRDKWRRVYDVENIVSCLSADDSNPYTRVPLILAGLRGLPAIACHHGALDARMAFKQQHADLYLAKGEMEKDYMLRVCRVSPEKVILGAPASAARSQASRVADVQTKPWMVFFSEPYEAGSWRPDEIYKELLPLLSALATDFGLKLMIKLHPFESAKSHRQYLERFLSREEGQRIELRLEPFSPDVWQSIRFALTVESTVAMECAGRGVPVFFCAWLRDAWTGYVGQYEKFGVGQALNSPHEIIQIPEMVSSYGVSFRGPRPTNAITATALRGVLSGSQRGEVTEKLEAK